MKALRLTFVFVTLLLSLFVSAGDQFPVGPNPNLTPGAVCQNSNTRRYKENIIYCERNVSTQTKREIIKMYDDQLGFQVGQMNRTDFKIDHFIPLSIGGSNSVDNLWPQHKSVFDLTDPLETELSVKIVAGLILQADAIRVIREAKLNLDRVPELLDYVQSLH